MSRRDPGMQLRRAIERAADAAGIVLSITRSDLTQWASATFAGARHELTLTVTPSARVDRWLGDLPETELPLQGHLVADLKIVAVVRTAATILVTLEILTVEDC